MTKYWNKITIVDGIRFDSKAEANYYLVLKARAAAGEITDFDPDHPKFEIIEAWRDPQGKRQRAIVYEADFAYTENGVRVVVDVKGVRTPVFKLKARLFQMRYPEFRFEIVDVRR